MSYCMEMVDSNFKVATENYFKVNKELKQHCFELEVDDDGVVLGIEFLGEKSTFKEDEMFARIAPMVENGSYIEMLGEDGERWRYLFEDSRMKKKTAKVSWSDDDE